MADQGVEIVDYDAAWPDRFAEQRLVVEALLGRWLSGAVEHIGSTAVPGLRAKPVIDMLAPVELLASAQVVVPVLEKAGWWYWPPGSRNAYTNAKADFVERALRRAGVQPPDRDLLPE